MKLLAMIWCMIATIVLLIVLPAALIQLIFQFCGVAISAPWAVAIWLTSVVLTVLITRADRPIEQRS